MAANSKPFYAVTGRSDTGAIFPRLPIQELQKKEEQFTLFILSYLILQDRGNELGPGPVPIPPGTGVAASTFFNIAAIHGKPYTRWPGDHKDFPTDFDGKDPKDTNPVPSRFGGYCNHGSVLFPTWHRPYVLLIEQAIGEQATALAKELDKLEKEPNSTKWQDAARELRFPYWDWASEEVQKEGLPKIFSDEKVHVRVPGSKDLVEVTNPLASYPLKIIPDDFTDEVDDENVKSYFTAWNTTLRHPTSNKNAEKSRTWQLDMQLKKRACELRSRVAMLFTFGNDEDSARVWDEFSNHSPVTVEKEPPPKGYGDPKASSKYRGSLEGVHDSVHDIIGGLGHMGFPDYAGFDPIFYLHHANVDRLYALWEYCYAGENNDNGYWMGNGYAVTNKQGITKIVPWLQNQGTYSEVYNGQVLPDSPLAPFRLETGDYWSSDEARSLDDSGFKKYYTYAEPDLGIDVHKSATLEERRAARAKVHAYYGIDPKDKKGTHGGLFEAVPDDVPMGMHYVRGFRQFIVSVELLEHAYNGPYSFRLYNKTRKDPDTGGHVLIGAVSVFARPDHSPCAACSGRRANGSTIRGIVVIDDDTVDDMTAQGDERIKDVFHAELTNPEGIQLAVVSSGEADEAAGHLSKESAPVRITLLSSGAARYKSDVDTEADQPISLVDWKSYGDLFSGGHRAWKHPRA